MQHPGDGWACATSDRTGRGTLTRRDLLGAGAAAAVTAFAGPTGATAPVTFGLTPVMLESDLKLLEALSAYLARRLQRPVSLVTRRTYQEITALLLSGQLDAAWICGFPYIQYRDELTLVAVPLWRGEPLYQSYVIVNGRNPATRIEELRGEVHAFSDPNSNSGHLVTWHLLATMGESPAGFFGRTFFTYGHRNVIRAVSAGLAQSGSVDGYVWEVMNETEHDLVAGTRVLRKSERLGFPPVACNARTKDAAITRAIADALISMPQDEDGRRILAMLYLDGFARGEPSLFDAIAQKYRFVLSQA